MQAPSGGEVKTVRLAAMLLRNRLEKIICVLLAFVMLLVSCQPVFAEGAGTEPSLDIQVDYKDATKEGYITADVDVTFLPGEGGRAVSTMENLEITMQGHNGLHVPQESWHYDSTTEVRFTARLRYEDPVPGVIPEEMPELVIRLTSSNCVGLEYIAKLDVQPETRILVIARGDLENGEYLTGTATVLDQDLMKGTRYGKKALPYSVNTSANLWGEDELGILGDDPGDENDITYIYLGTHGYLSDDWRGGADTLVFEDESGNAVKYEEIIQYVDKTVKGRYVLILDCCFSGKIVEAAEISGIDAERGYVLSSTTNRNTTSISRTSEENAAFNKSAPVTTQLGYAIARTAEKTKEYSTCADLLESTYDFMVIADGVHAAMRNAVTKTVYFFGALEEENRNKLVEPTAKYKPTGYGNDQLPLFVAEGYNYDDGFRLPVLKDEKKTPIKPMSVVFSYDEPYEWSGKITMYMLDGEGHIIAENSDNPQDWKYRRVLTIDGYGYRPAPLDSTGGISTRACAVRIDDSRILVEVDVGRDAMGPNPPLCDSWYTVCRLDGANGIEAEMTGRFAGKYSMFASGGRQEAEEAVFSLNGERCDRETMTEAFGAYGAAFEEDELNVRDERFPFLTVFPRATVPGRTVELKDIRSSVASELPPTYEELVAAYGLSE